MNNLHSVNISSALTIGRIVFLSVCILFNTQVVKSQIAIEWQNRVGTSTYDVAYAINNANNGALIMAGVTKATPGDLLIVKVDSSGNQIWQNSFGGTNDDRANDIIETIDGGTLAVGPTYSDDGDVVGSHGAIDAWIVKTNLMGNLEWQWPAGGSNNDNLYKVIINSAGNYVACGSSSSSNGDLTGVPNNFYNGQMWIIEFDSAGSIIDQALYGGTSNDVAFNMVQTSDYGYVLCGASMGAGNEIDTNYGNWDCCIVKVDSNLNVQWTKVYGGSNQEQAYDIKQTPDGAYIVCGETGSSNIFVNGFHGGHDFWVFKLDSAGNFEWQNCIGGSAFEDAHAVEVTHDGKYLVSGLKTGSTNGDVSFPLGNGYDFWIVCIDSSGNLIWDKSLGGGSADLSYCMISTTDDKYAIAGFTGSLDHDVNPSPGTLSDIWVVKFSDSPNSILGEAFIDLDSDLIRDSNESSLSGYYLNESYTGRKSLTDYSGTYRLDLPKAGNYSVSGPVIPYYNALPAVRNFNFNGVGEIDTLNDFAYQASVTVNDLEVILTDASVIRPGFYTTYDICIKNVGTTTISGFVKLGHSSMLQFLGSTDLPSQTSSDSTKWSFSNLSPYSTRQISVTYIASPLLSLGSNNQMIATVQPLIGDFTPSNNTDTLNQEVVGSYDPNDIQVDKSSFPYSQVANPPYLEYLIRFQNTGTFPATFIRVTNPISQNLDLNTFEFINASHGVDVSLLTHSRNLDFFFDNINLPDSFTNEPGSHGFIKYRIKPVAGLAVTDIIDNQAFIYFDFNQPVITNTATTVITITTATEPDQVRSNDMSVFPNPCTDEVFIEIGDPNIKEGIVYIRNVFGQEILRTKQLDLGSNNTTSVDLSSLSASVYIIEFRSSETRKVSKLIKQ